MTFSSHPNFDKEMAAFLKKHHQDDGWLFKLQNLLTNYESGKTNLGVGVLAPIGECEGYKLFKVYMAVGGVSKNDRPRVCFAKKDQTIIFLCYGTHIENYQTRDLITKGKQRLKEFIGV